MSNKNRFKTFWDFYPYYLTEHQNKVCRTLHFIGTGIVLGLFFTSLIKADWHLFVAIPFAGYGFAWAGHFFFEKNKPATFQYPLYSLGSDFVMFFHIITLQLPKKMQEARKLINNITGL